MRFLFRMTSANEVEDWFHAVNLYDEGKLEEAIKSFKSIPQNAKTAFNIGCSYLTLGNVQLAAKVLGFTNSFLSHKTKMCFSAQ